MVVLIHFVINYTTSECIPSYPLCLTIVINTSLFIFLFGKFYVESYSNKNKIQINGSKANQGVMISANGEINGRTRHDMNGNGLVNRKKLMNANK